MRRPDLLAAPHNLEDSNIQDNDILERTRISDDVDVVHRASHMATYVNNKRFDSSSYTEGSVLYVDSNGKLKEKNASFFYDDTKAALGLGTVTISSNAILQLSSTTKGFLLPVMDVTQRDAISVSAPADLGLMIYNSSDDIPNYWDGTSWGAFVKSGTSGGSFTQNYIPFGASDGSLTEHSSFTYTESTRKFYIDGNVSIGGANSHFQIDLPGGLAFKVYDSGHIAVEGGTSLSLGDVALTTNNDNGIFISKSGVIEAGTGTDKFVAIGYGVTASRNTTAIGYNSNLAAADNATLYGYSTNAADLGTAIGYAATATTVDRGTAIGAQSTTIHGGLALHGASTTAIEQFAVGRHESPISDVIIGKGVTTANAVSDVIIRPTTTTLAATDGADLILKGGVGTGTNGGVIIAQTDGTKLFESNDTGFAFNANSPIAKPSITGSRGLNLALGILLTALDNLGIVDDNTTA